MSIRKKAPYKVLYSNDTTNILTCKSPFNPKPGYEKDLKTGLWVYKPSVFTADMLEATVDETADIGIDVHLLQPGLGWIPWWKSKVYPFEDHIRFMKKYTGMDPDDDGFASYMANGGDMVQVFIDRCRLKGLAPFVSFRLNDSHGHEFTTMDRSEIPAWAWHVFCPTHINHPEWRISKDIKDWNGRVLNWAIPEVRSAKMALIREIIEQYDIDGFELDFMRHCNFFNQKETTSMQRRNIITDFVKEVRILLDESAKPGQYRWLCIRIPSQISWYDKLGLSIEALVDVGVNMINLSNYYYTEDRGDFAAVRQMANEQTSLYLELCHTIRQKKVMDSVNVTYDSTLQRKTTPLQYYTAAYLAQRRGCDGCSTFNFVYYRQHGVGERGPASEPPFYIHKGLGSLDWLSKQPQHYFMTKGWTDSELPANMKSGSKLLLKQDMTPPLSGWKGNGILRIQAEEDLGESDWKATLNCVNLIDSDNRAEPYENPYPQLLGTAKQHRAWVVPAEALNDGVNTIEITLKEGPSTTVVFVDLAIQ